MTRDASQGSRSHPTPLERQLAAFAYLQRPSPALLDIVCEARTSFSALGQRLRAASASLQRANPALLDKVSAASNSLRVFSQYAEILISLARQQIVSQVAPILDRCRLDVSAIVRVAQPLLRQIEELFGPGTFLGDVVLATDSEHPDVERLEALARLADKWFRKPLHRARWRLAEPELRRRAHERGTSIEAELKAATLQAIPLALADAGEEPLSDYLSKARAALANRLMDDLAGPEWRRRGRGVEVLLDNEQDEGLRGLDVEYEAEVKATHEAFWRLVASLPRSQRDAILARIEGRALTNAQHQALYRLHRSPQFLEIARAAS